MQKAMEHGHLVLWFTSIKHCDFPCSYVSLPEAKSKNNHHRNNFISPLDHINPIKPPWNPMTFQRQNARCARAQRAFYAPPSHRPRTCRRSRSKIHPLPVELSDAPLHSAHRCLNWAVVLGSYNIIYICTGLFLDFWIKYWIYIYMDHTRIMVITCNNPSICQLN